MKSGDPVICAECERLWSNFQRATHEHQHLVARLKGDAASVGRAGAAFLIQQINDADLARKTAREALENHQIAAGHRQKMPEKTLSIVCTPESRNGRQSDMFPMLGSTSAMIHQLSADLFECLDCSWMLVTMLASTRISARPAAMFVFGAPPSADCTAAIKVAPLVCPIAIERAAGALALGPKINGAGYLQEEIDLTEEFAAHIARILRKDSRARSWMARTA